MSESFEELEFSGLSHSAISLLTFDQFQYVTEGVLIFVIGIIGLIGNAISIWTFSRQHVHRIFHNLLLVLGIFDIIYVACSIHLFALEKFWVGYDQLYRIPSSPVVIPIAQIGLMGSVYCTVALTLERFLAVCYPFLPRRHVYSTKTFIIPVILFTCLYNVPKFFELDTKKTVIVVNVTLPDSGLVVEKNLSNLELNPKPMRLDPLYIRIYILWMNLFFHIIGPFVFLIVLNYKVHTRIKEYEKTLTDTLRVCFNRSNTHSQTRSDPALDSDTDSGADTVKSRRQFKWNSRSPRNTGQHEDIMLAQSSSSSHPHPNRLGSVRSQGCERISSRSPAHWSNANSIDAAPLSTSSCGRTGRRRGHHRKRKTQSFSTPRKREVLLSRISFYIVFMFLSCHSVRLIPNTFEVIHTYRSDYNESKLPWPTWVARITNISHVLLTLVCSSNFYIYYFKHGSLCRRMTEPNMKSTTHSTSQKRLRVSTATTMV